MAVQNVNGDLQLDILKSIMGSKLTPVKDPLNAHNAAKDLN